MKKMKKCPNLYNMSELYLASFSSAPEKLYYYYCYLLIIIIMKKCVQANCVNNRKSSIA